MHNYVYIMNLYTSQHKYYTCIHFQNNMEQKSISSMWASKEIVLQVEHAYPQNIIKYNYYEVKLYIIIIIGCGSEYTEHDKV